MYEHEYAQLTISLMMSPTQCTQLVSFSQAAVQRLQTHLDASYVSSPPMDLFIAVPRDVIDYKMCDVIDAQHKPRLATRINDVLASILPLLFSALQKRDLNPPTNTGTIFEKICVVVLKCAFAYLCTRVGVRVRVRVRQREKERDSERVCVWERE